MSAITVNFSEEERTRINEKARESGMLVEELIRLSVMSVVFPSEEEDFSDIKSDLLAKYGDVYRKLA